jgi:dihydrofolate reductase
MRISIIAALSERGRVIGRDNDLPWSRQLGPDMHRFKEVTKGHPVIMGRRTWESLPKRFRPLPARDNFVLSTEPRVKFHQAWRAYTLDHALELAEESAHNEIFVIGGGAVYAEALPKADRLYLTLVDEDPEGDTFFPDYSDFTSEIERSVVPGFAPKLTFLTLERK